MEEQNNLPENNQPSNKVRVLYDSVSKRYSLGTYDEFYKKMQSSEKRKVFFDAVSKTYNLGDFKTFEQKMSGSAVAEPSVEKSLTPKVTEKQTPPESTKKSTQRAEDKYSFASYDKVGGGIEQLKSVDYNPNLNLPNDKLVSESTRTKFTPQLRRPEGLVVKSFEEEEVKRNAGKRVAAEKIAKSKYGTPTESQIQSELKTVQQKAKDKELVPYTNQDGSIDYRQEAGFFEGILNGVNKALINAQSGILKIVIPSEYHALLNQSQDLKLKESELDPLQSFGNIFKQIDPVQAVVKFMPYGDVEEAYKSRQGLDVSYEGAAPVAGELIGTVGTYALMPEGAIAKASSVAAFSFLQNYSQTTNQLFKELKEKGLTDSDAAKQAQVDGVFQALPKTALDVYFFGRTPVKAPNQAALNLFQTMGHVAKQSAKFGALSGAEVAATDGIRNLQNIFQKREYNTDDTEGKVFDAVVHGAAMGVVMESIPHILRLPKVAKSAIFDYATKDIVKPIITEALKNLPENISVPFAEGMKKFEEANKGMADIVPEDKSHVVGGITTRIKVIEGEIEKLNEQKKSVPESLHENIDKKIADLEQEKKEANQRITTALNSQNPLEVEYDEVGNKLVSETQKEETKKEPKEEIKSFANRISKGEKLNSPEDLQFYENNKKEIEDELKSMAAKEQAKLTPEQIEQNIISQEGKVEDEKINELIDKAKTYEPTGTETETVGTGATPTGEISSRPASAFEFLKSESEDVRRDFDEWRRENYKSDNEFRREYEREHLSEFGESEEEFIHRKYREKVCP